MTDRSDALFRPLPAAGAERISSDVDVGSRAVRIGEPGLVTRFQNCLQEHNTLRHRARIIPAQEKCDSLSWLKATGKESLGEAVHGSTPRDHAGHSSSRARFSPGFRSSEGGAYAASSSVESSSSAAALAARSSFRIEFTRISQMVCSELVFLLSYLRLRNSPSTWMCAPFLSVAANSPSLPKTTQRCHSVCSTYLPSFL